MLDAKFDTAGCILYSPFLEMAKIWHFYGKTWSLHGPSNWFYLNLNQCAKGCTMQNFMILDVSHSPLFLEMGKIWPFWPEHGPHMVLQIGFSWIIFNVPRDVPRKISYCWVNIVTLFVEMAKIWPFYGKNIALTWSFKLILHESQCAQGCSIPNFRVPASILTDFPIFLLEKGRKEERKKGSK